MVSKIKQYQNLIKSLIKVYCYNAVHTDYFLYPISFSLEHSGVRIPIYAFINMKINGNLIEEEDANNVYVGIDLSKNCKFYYDKTYTSSYTFYTEVLVSSIYKVFIRDREFLKFDKQWYQDNFGNYSTSDFAGNIGYIENTKMYKDLESEIESIEKNVKVDISLKDSQYPSIKNRKILPLFYLDFNKNRLVTNTGDDTTSYRKNNCSVSLKVASRDFGVLFGRSEINFLLLDAKISGTNLMKDVWCGAYYNFYR